MEAGDEIGHRAEAERRTGWIWEHLNPIDPAALREQYRAARPHHFFCIDDFLRPEFAREVAAAYATETLAAGDVLRFERLNEKGKRQITDVRVFPPALRTLHEIIASRELLDLFEEITGIRGLRADPTLSGAGVHIMGRGGHLEPHIDFNMQRSTGLHRRLNILVYLTPGWEEDWGGCFDLWDADVRERQALVAPRFNRCVLFNTTETSFHGVTPIEPRAEVTRNSFAAYYYTEEPPPDWTGSFHSTIYATRPGEWWKAHVRMPAERLRRRTARALRDASGAARKRLRRVLPGTDGDG